MSAPAMGLGRRNFLGSVSIGSAAVLVGCAESPPPSEEPPCPLPAPTTRPALDYPEAAYFESIARELDAHGEGGPVAWIDLDRLDANIDEIVSAMPTPSAHRIVEKSLPSLDLLAYVAMRSGSQRFLVLHLPFLAPLLERFPEADVVVGKTHLTSAVEAFFLALPSSEAMADAAARVTFLADSVERIEQLVALAERLDLTLRLGIEIDVGLRRSGASEPIVVERMLEALLATDRASLRGLVGYDGHVPHTPRGTPEGALEAWEEATAAYQSFVDVLADERFAAIVGPDVMFHSGGSATYPLYATGTPVNDVAAGGGVLRPADYPQHFLGALAPAVFVSSPVLSVQRAPLLPFFDASQSARIFGGRQGLTIQGGGWPAHVVHPAAVEPAPLVTDPTNPSMISNQSSFSVPAETEVAAGDWVHFHPRQSDLLFQFETIRLVRGGRVLEESMRPYPRRY